jgi:hypothetical protein
LGDPRTAFDFGYDVFRFYSVYECPSPRGIAVGHTSHGITICKPIWALAWHLQRTIFNSESLGSVDGVAFNAPTNQPIAHQTEINPGIFSWYWLAALCGV